MTQRAPRSATTKFLLEATRRKPWVRRWMKERLKPLVLEGNRQKVMSAPATAILGYDTKFYDWLPRLFPHMDVAPGSLRVPLAAKKSNGRTDL